MGIKNMMFQQYGELVNNHDDTVVQKRSQLKDYRNGKALRGHCASAHQGAVDSGCRACQEIQSKMGKLGVDFSSTNVVEII